MRSIKLNPTQKNNIANQMNLRIESYNSMASLAKCQNDPTTNVLASLKKTGIQGMVAGLYAMGVIVELRYENEDAYTGKITGWEIL